MTDLPYTYTDFDGDQLIVSPSWISIHDAGVHAPTGEDAVDLMQAINAAAGDTQHRVVHVADLLGAENAVRAMRQRAAYLVEYSPDMSRGDLAEAIRALPLTPDSDDAAEEPPARYRDIAGDLWEDQGDGKVRVIESKWPDEVGITLPHAIAARQYGPLTPITTDAPEVAHSGGSQERSETPSKQPDFRALLVAELLGATVDDAAEELDDDPTGTWERAYAAWTNHRRDAATRTNTRYEERLAALEGLTRSIADLVEGHSVDLSQAKAAIRGLARRPLTVDTDH